MYVIFIIFITGSWLASRCPPVCKSVVGWFLSDKSSDFHWTCEQRHDATVTSCIISVFLLVTDLEICIAWNHLSFYTWLGWVTTFFRWVGQLCRRALGLGWLCYEILGRLSGVCTESKKSCEEPTVTIKKPQCASLNGYFNCSSVVIDVFPLGRLMQLKCPFTFKEVS